jgi:hypothetical protein
MSPKLKKFAMFFVAVVFLIVFGFYVFGTTGSDTKSANTSQDSQESVPVKSDTSDALNNCIQSHDDGAMSDAQLEAQCSDEVIAWSQDCQKSGGGDEQTCEGKTADVVTMDRAMKRYNNNSK